MHQIGRERKFLVRRAVFANTLNKLEKAGKIHRIKEGKASKVALGGRPEASDEAA